VGKTGEVYLPIPGTMSGFGKVQVTFSDRQHELKAITRGENLETGAMVKIVECIDDKLVVERIA